MMRKIPCFLIFALLVPALLASSCTGSLRNGAGFCISDAMIVTDPGDALVVQRSHPVAMVDSEGAVGLWDMCDIKIYLYSLITPFSIDKLFQMLNKVLNKRI